MWALGICASIRFDIEDRNDDVVFIFFFSESNKNS